MKFLCFIGFHKWICYSDEYDIDYCTRCEIFSEPNSCYELGHEWTAYAKYKHGVRQNVNRACFRCNKEKLV